MIKVATFKITRSLFHRSEEAEANAFLATHKPAPQGINFNKDTIVVFYEEDPAADLVELLDSVRAARFQMEVAMHVAKAELAELNATHNKGRFEEVNAGVIDLQKKIDIQGIKEAFVLKKIEEKRATK